MSHRLRRFTAAIATCALLIGMSAPAFGRSGDLGNSRRDTVPVVFDAFIMRPIGLAMTCAGFVAWVLNTPMMAMTRPVNMNKPFNTLVIQPARFTFVDPLGFHPDRVRAAESGEIL